MIVTPLPDTLIAKFGSVLVLEDWKFLSQNMTSTELVGAFEKHTTNLVNEIFPEKQVTVSDRDKPYMTEELRLLKRQRQRVYTKWGKNARYNELQKEFDIKIKLEAQKYRKN